MTLLLSGCLLPGCSLFNRTPAPLVAPPLKTMDKPFVTAEQVSPNNARQKAHVLNEEMDRDIDGEWEDE
jgi:hypothetical protein